MSLLNGCLWLSLQLGGEVVRYGRAARCGYAAESGCVVCPTGMGLQRRVRLVATHILRS